MRDAGDRSAALAGSGVAASSVQLPAGDWATVLDCLCDRFPGIKRRQDDCALFIIKNVTRYELGENVDELFERFKRADTSRHTEGSGLGLAISQSIVDLHGGSMRIDVDGDLFKVTVSIQTS